MNTSRRIRYTQVNNDLLQSVRTYHSALGVNLRVMINLSTLEFAVLNDTETVISQGKGLYIHDTKIKAKKALQELGVTFSDEKRERTEENAG